MKNFVLKNDATGSSADRRESQDKSPESNLQRKKSLSRNFTDESLIKSIRKLSAR